MDEIYELYRYLPIFPQEEIPKINGFAGFRDPENPNHPDIDKHWSEKKDIR